MKIIPRYVLREHAGPLIFAASALTAIMLLNYIAKNLGSLVGKGLEWTVIAEFFLLSVPFTVAMTLPMAILVAVLYGFSRLASENEITALRASGVPMRKLLTPVLIASIFFTLGMVTFNDQLLPRTNHRLRTLQGDIARKKPSFALRPQIINEVSPGGFYLSAVHIDPIDSKLRDVTIYDVTDQRRRHTIVADSGSMAFSPDGKDLRLTLHNGYIQEVPTDQPTQLQRVYYKKDVIRVADVANSFQRDSSDSYKSDREMSICQLQQEVARYERDYLLAWDRHSQASALLAKDPNANVPLTSSSAAPDVSESRQRSLGRVYCQGLRWLERKGIGKLTNFAVALLPEAALAQAAAAATAQIRQQSAGRDSAVQDSLQRARRDSVVRDSLAALLPMAATTQPVADSVPPQPPAPAPIAPSMGVAPTIPAKIAMETERANMLASRSQMNQFAVEIHKKFAISVACIVFVLLGAPLALRFPRGGVGLVIGVSLVVFALYYVGLIAGESLADKNILGPGIAMWAANVVFTIVGLLLLTRMDRDAGSNRGGDWSQFLNAFRRLHPKRVLRRGSA
ncbi:MAG: LptF/LptG family permease [Gemmatimonadota bacterium]